MKRILVDRIEHFKARLAMLRMELSDLFEETEEDGFDRGYDAGYGDGLYDARPERDKSGKFVKRS